MRAFAATIVRDRNVSLVFHGKQDSTSIDTSSDDVALPSSEIPSTEIVASLLRTAHRLRCVLNAQLAEFGLSDVRLAVLKAIQHSAPAGCSQSELAVKLDQWESSISTLVDRMRENRLLYRLQSKSDRRKRVLILSEQGIEALDRAQAVYDEQMYRLTKRIDPQQRRGLISMLELLQTEIAEIDREGPILAKSAPRQQPETAQTGAVPTIKQPPVSGNAAAEISVPRIISDQNEQAPAA